jgi:hypothetical protein
MGQNISISPKRAHSRITAFGETDRNRQYIHLSPKSFWRVLIKLIGFGEIRRKVVFHKINWIRQNGNIFPFRRKDPFTHYGIRRNGSEPAIYSPFAENFFAHSHKINWIRQNGNILSHFVESCCVFIKLIGFGEMGKSCPISPKSYCLFTKINWIRRNGTRFSHFPFRRKDPSAHYGIRRNGSERTI